MRHLLFILLLTISMLALADDEDALLLADQAPGKTAQASDWRIFTEGVLGSVDQRNNAPTLRTARWSLDVQYDTILTPGWRLMFSDRLDITSQDSFQHSTTINTLKEAYVSWQPANDKIVDLGRINMRSGVATGYNPTDYFRAGALRSVTSIDPISLKKNRQGSVMLRGQKLWDGGAMTALVSPKLADQSNRASFNPDLGATNAQARWLLGVSHKFAENFAPQVLLHGVSGQSPQLGLNLTAVVSDASVAYFEWSGGRSQSLRTQALNGADDSAFRNRLATGLTYTTSNKISVNLEYDYNGAALDKAGWNALRSGSPAAYGRYRSYANSLQEPPTRHSIFVYSTWQDALLNHFDLAGMLRFNLADSSRLTWIEGRYHWEHVDLALQWQRNSGQRSSEFGALTQQRIVQAVLTYFF